MKYAFISDIHGNFPALQAVLEDAKTQGIEQYIFLGDYIQDLPWPNEVAETLQKLDKTIIIRGNKEGYLENMKGKDQSAWIYEQMAPIYWNYRELTTDNLNYLISLPPSAEIQADNGERIYLSHSSPIFYRKPKMEPFHSSRYLLKMLEAPFSHEDYLAFSGKVVLENAEAMSEISALPRGVYVFGHNHLQWHKKINDKLFINAGSCGMSLNFDIRATYTVLEQTDEGWYVDERRVKYDVEGTVSKLLSSGLYAKAEIWSRVTIWQLKTGGDYISLFLAHAESLAQEQGFPSRPVSDEIWRSAAESFKLMKIYNPDW